MPERSRYARALARFAALRARDQGEDLHPDARSRLYAHGEVRPISVVLLHGFTNSPGQFSALARVLADAGASVVVPRLPHHGAADRDGARLRALTGEELQATAERATRCARDLGETVVVCGISLGGMLALDLAARRRDVARAVAIAPLLGVMRAGRLGTIALERFCDALPGTVVPWDPEHPRDPHPPYGYPGFALGGLGASLGFARALEERAKREPARGGGAIVLLNPRDPACDNRVARRIAARWNRSRRWARCIDLAGLPENHDIIDPTHPKACVRAVYPEVIRAVLGD